MSLLHQPSISCAETGSSSPTVASVAAGASRYLSAVTVLRCSSVSPSWRDGALEALQAIEEVDLHNFAYVEDAAAARLFQACPRARRVNLCSCRRVQDHAIIAVAKSCLSLQELNLTGNPNVTVQALDEVVRNCSRLMSLDLAGCDRISETHILGKYARFCDIFDEEEDGPWTA